MSGLEELELWTESFEIFSAFVDVDARLVRADYVEGRMRYCLLPVFLDLEWPALKLRKVSFRTLDDRKRTMFTQDMARESLAGV